MAMKSVYEGAGRLANRLLLAMMASFTKRTDEVVARGFTVLYQVELQRYIH